jgi:hypothetical protein
MSKVCKAAGVDEQNQVGSGKRTDDSYFYNQPPSFSLFVAATVLNQLPEVKQSQLTQGGLYS